MYDSSVQKELLSLKSEPEATLIDRHSDVKQSVTRDQQYKSLEENAQKDYSEIYGLVGFV